MPDKSYIAIGDIHGCLEPLDRLLHEIAPFSDRTHVFLGDYIDRGPDSYGVVERLLKFSETHECVFLRGNHEQMLVDAALDGEAESWALWLANGGSSTLDSYRRAGTNPLEAAGHADFYVSTDFFFDTDQFLFVHGGVNPNLTVAENLSQSDPNEFLWERRHLDAPTTRWEKTVVFGHTPRKDVLLAPPLVGLDTGCVFADRGYGTLTAMLFPEMRPIACNCKAPSDL